MKINPDDFIAWIIKGTVFLNLRNFKEAEKALLLALEHQPEAAAAWYNLNIAVFPYISHSP
ncbi:MAG: tetratricopeptide repeat protein [Candidatus Odinarchaeota archaeon]